MRKAIAVIGMLICVNSWAEGHKPTSDQLCKGVAGMYQAVSTAKNDGWTKDEIVAVMGDADNKGNTRIVQMVVDDVWTSYPHSKPNDVAALMYTFCIAGSNKAK